MKIKKILILVSLLVSAPIGADASKQSETNNLKTKLIVFSKENHEISFEGQKMIKKWFVNIGQQVKKGEKIVQLDCPILTEEVKVKRTTFNSYDAEFQSLIRKKDGKNVKRNGELVPTAGRSYYELISVKTKRNIAFQEYKLSQSKNNRCLIVSEIDGVITNIEIQQGKFIKPNETFAFIANEKKLFAQAYVLDRRLKYSSIEKGTKLNLTINNRKYQGVVETKSRLGNVQQFTLHIKIENDENLEHGMFGTIND